MRELLNSEVNLVSGAGIVTNNEVGGRFPYEITGTVVDPDPNKRPRKILNKDFLDMIHDIIDKLFS